MTIDNRDQLIASLGNNHTRSLIDKAGIARAAPKIAYR